MTNIDQRPEWLHFLAALKSQGKTFEEIQATANRHNLILAVGISDPLIVAAIETIWEKKLKVLGDVVPGNFGFVNNVDGSPTVSSGVQIDDQTEGEKISASVAKAFKLSWIANFFLFAFKLVAAVATGSQSILASLADSAVDLLSQAVIAVAEAAMGSKHDDYPVGRSRLEALGVLACACIMSMASAFVIQSASTVLYQGFAKHVLPEIHFDWIMIGILCGGTIVKFFLYLYCRQFTSSSDSMQALAEDHLNDVISNSGAIVAGIAAEWYQIYWWIDGVSAVVISVWIIYRWWCLTQEQMEKLVGKTAPPAFIAKCNHLATRHHQLMRVDTTRAYHMGARFAVEMEVVLPATMTLRESHDIAVELQHKIEALEECERAFVHVDYQFRDQPEHKTERLLEAKATPAPSAPLARSGTPQLKPIGVSLSGTLESKDLESHTDTNALRT